MINLANLEINYQYLSLSLSLSLSCTYYRDRVLLFVKFGLNKNNLFKYCADVENCESFRGFRLNKNNSILKK